MNKPKLRISPFVSSLIIGVAVLYDGLQALIDFLSFGLLGWIVNPLINLWAFLTFFTWFWLKDIHFYRLNRITTFGGTVFFEMLPFLNDLPTWTASVIILLAQTYAEDLAEGISPSSLKAFSSVLSTKKENKTESI